MDQKRIAFVKHRLPHDQIKKKLGNTKEKKRQDIDTLMIAKPMSARYSAATMPKNNTKA